MSSPKSASQMAPAKAKTLSTPKSRGLGLRRANAYVGLLSVLALCYHSFTMGYSMWSGWYNEDVSVSSAWCVAACVVTHVILVLVLFFFFAEGGTTTYKCDPHSIIIQRVSAILILIFLHFHINAYKSVALGEKLDTLMFIFYVATELVFFAFVACHVAVSIAPGLATVHWARSPKTIRRIDIICYISCAIAFVAYTGGMIHFYLEALV